MAAGRVIKAGNCGGIMNEPIRAALLARLASWATLAEPIKELLGF